MEYIKTWLMIMAMIIFVIGCGMAAIFLGNIVVEVVKQYAGEKLASACGLFVVISILAIPIAIGIVKLNKDD